MALLFKQSSGKDCQVFSKYIDLTAVKCKVAVQFSLNPRSGTEFYTWMLRVGKGQILPSSREAASFSVKQKRRGQETGKQLIAEINNSVLPDFFFFFLTTGLPCEPPPPLSLNYIFHLCGLETTTEYQSNAEEDLVIN